GGIENLLAGHVALHDVTGGVTRLRLAGGLGLSVPLSPELALDAPVTVAVRAEDVLVSIEPVRGLSARNVYEGVVRGVERGPGDTTVRCLVHRDLPEWLARLTPAAVAELGLLEGSTVWLAVKSHSVQVVSAAAARADGPRV